MYGIEHIYIIYYGQSLKYSQIVEICLLIVIISLLHCASSSSPWILCAIYVQKKPFTTYTIITNCQQCNDQHIETGYV